MLHDPLLRCCVREMRISFNRPLLRYYLFRTVTVTVRKCTEGNAGIFYAMSRRFESFATFDTFTDGRASTRLYCWRHHPHYRASDWRAPLRQPERISNAYQSFSPLRFRRLASRQSETVAQAWRFSSLSEFTATTGGIRHGMRSTGRTKYCPPLLTLLSSIRNCFRRSNNRLLRICHSPTTSLTSRSAFLICVNFASTSCAISSTCVIIASMRV